MQKIISLSLLLLLSACTTPVPESELGESASFLTGTWKVEGAEEYEVWKKETADRYTAFAYRIKNGEKQIWERMVVSKENGIWQLGARVPDQNEGEAVVFTLVSGPSDSGEWLFENKEHDFPTRILYKEVTDEEWFADVRGDDGEGFSITLKRSLK